MPKYFIDNPITPDLYEKLIEAMKEDLPTIIPLMISDRTDEIASIPEAMTTRINVVTKMQLHDYINPYLLTAETCRAWNGFIDHNTGEIKSASELSKAVWRQNPQNNNITRFTVSFMDIRNFVYEIELGNSQVIYDLFASKFYELSKAHCTALRAHAGKVFSIQSIYSRYIGGLDGILARISNYRIFLQQRANVIKTNSSSDNLQESLDEIRPAASDIPYNNYELKELFTLFISTWVRANMVMRFIVGRRDAKTDEEKYAVKNELILNWWYKESPERYTKSDLFTFAMRNLFLSNIAHRTGVSSIDYDGGAYSGKALPETLKEHEVMIDDLMSYIEAMTMVINDIRSRAGNVPPSRTIVREDTVKLVEEIVLN